MNFIDDSLLAYVEAHTTVESPILKKINRHTHANVLKPRMLSGHLQGRVLSMISKMVRPKRILEIGTYTGYSAICLAEGLATGGKLITIEVNEELAESLETYFQESGFASSIELKIGLGSDIIPTLTESFDLVFIDADKENYSHYYNLVFDKLNPGGFILADNVLWSGKVLTNKPDKDTLAIKEFNRKISEDPRVENVLLPIRDGIMIIRKLSL